MSVKHTKGRSEEKHNIVVSNDIKIALKYLDNGFVLNKKESALEHKEGGYFKISKKVLNHLTKKLNENSDVTNIIISNVKNPDNKYKGSYKKIFSIVNKDDMFSEVYETEESKGLVGTDYHLQLSQSLDADHYEKISKLKNVKILN